MTWGTGPHMGASNNHENLAWTKNSGARIKGTPNHKKDSPPQFAETPMLRSLQCFAASFLEGVPSNPSSCEMVLLLQVPTVQDTSPARPYIVLIYGKYRNYINICIR